MGGVLLSFSGMAIAGRELSDTMNTFEIVFFRALIYDIKTDQLQIHLFLQIFS